MEYCGNYSVKGAGDNETGVGAQNEEGLEGQFFSKLGNFGKICDVSRLPMASCTDMISFYLSTEENNILTTLESS